MGGKLLPVENSDIIFGNVELLSVLTDSLSR